MATTLKQIVLVDRWGEELFSGKSLLSSVPPAPPTSSAADVADVYASDHEDAVPPTLRSSVFVRIGGADNGRGSRSEIHVSEVMPVAPRALSFPRAETAESLEDSLPRPPRAVMESDFDFKAPSLDDDDEAAAITLNNNRAA